MLSKEGFLEYGAYFDKVEKFPGEKYHIQLVDDAKRYPRTKESSGTHHAFYIRQNSRR